MKVRTLVFAAAWLVLTASVSAEAPKASKELLQGKWSGVVEVNDAELQADEKFKEVPAEQAQLVLKIVKDQFSQMKVNLTFGEDGTTTGEFFAPDVPEKDKKQTGTWEVVKTDGPNITIRITSAKDNEEDEAAEGDDDESEDADDDGEDTEEEETATKAAKEIREMTFTFADERTMTAADMGDKLPEGVTFKFTKE
ncbi:MAG: hypothetical protein DCC68_19490 [Planctomycetota bacterium]|nr:MAG: hypothetical protein DCC68_19490 [Planctomycetota bacterium]